MTDPRTFTVTLTQQERSTIMFALGAYTGGVLNTMNRETFIFLDLDGLLALATKLMDAPPIPSLPPFPYQQAQAPNPGRSVPDRQIQPVELADRWARNKKGEEVPFPEGYQAVEVRLERLDRNDLKNGQPRMMVVYSVSGQTGFGNASCFDEKLFPFLANRLKQHTWLFVVHKDKYLNVVGVRA
jgi:hypothetical protein